MAVPSNRVPVRVARGLKSTLTANVSDLLEGEVVYAKDEDKLYVIEGGSLVATGGATSIGELSDVDTTTAAPTDNQALVWNNSNSEWEPGDVVTSDTTTGGTGSSQVLNIVTISQANYDALGTPDAGTVYFIV